MSLSPLSNYISLSPAPYHIIAFSFLLGSTIYQSFFGGPIAFRALARPHFSALQQKVFPIFFLLQTVLPLILYLTHPVGVTRIWALYTGDNKGSGFWEVESTEYLIGTMFVSGLVNWWVVGPATVRTMKARKALETREAGLGKEKGSVGYGDKGKKDVSPEMRALNVRFGILRGVSSLINLVGMIAMVGYAVSLGGAVEVAWAGK